MTESPLHRMTANKVVQYMNLNYFSIFFLSNLLTHMGGRTRRDFSVSRVLLVVALATSKAVAATKKGRTL
jgi:hypothetical protein